MTIVRPLRPLQRTVADADVIVVGSGIAGLVAALALAPRRVTLLTKTPGLAGGSTSWAQGGIAAAVGADDTPECHAADTMAAGAGLNPLSTVRLLTRDGAARLRELIARGAPFDRDADGAILLGREAAHGRRRVVHAGGDATGRHIHHWLAEQIATTSEIDVQTAAFAWDLAVQDGRVCGVLAYQARDGWVLYRAPFVVLATGGAGQLFHKTTNPPEATADGLAIAARAGARLADLEFVQFHPTALADPNAAAGAPLPLLTEALRGEGATLVDSAGRRFMPDQHADAELAPRDVVARAIWRRLADGAGAFLDMRAIMAGSAAARFPTVAALCAAAGYDPARQPVPVAPAAHYYMGGVAADDRGRTSLDGLWVCGEAAATGVHGANRLASNSLLEGLVFGRRVAEDITGRLAAPARPPALSEPSVPAPEHADTIARLSANLRVLMYDKVGLSRDGAGLRAALAGHDNLAAAIGELGRQSAPATPSLDQVRRWGELTNMALAARLMTVAAWRRQESRGAHYRVDFPRPAQAVGVRQFLTIDDLAQPYRPLDLTAPATTARDASNDSSDAAPAALSA